MYEGGKDHHVELWKPPLMSAYKINVDYWQDEYHTRFAGGAVVRNNVMEWFVGLSMRTSSDSALFAILHTLKEMLVKAWDFHSNNLEEDLEKDVLQHLQNRPLGTLLLLRNVVHDS